MYSQVKPAFNTAQRARPPTTTVGRSQPTVPPPLPPILIPNRNASLTDPALPIATLPYEVLLNDGLNTKLRVISYTAPHVQSFDLLPCLVDMMSTAFAEVRNSQDPHARLLHNDYSCSENSFGLKLTGNQITVPLEYWDLISLAKMLVMFQQKYTMPGLQFEYWFKGHMLGQGYAWMQFVESANATGTLTQA